MAFIIALIRVINNNVSSFIFVYGQCHYNFKAYMCYILIMILSVIAVAIFGWISYANAVSSNDNLTKVFDCVNQKANERAILSLVDAFVCHDKELLRALKYSE